MGLIRIYQGRSKSKKKPGWQEQAAQHDEWLKRINSMTLFDNKKPAKAGKKVDPVVKDQYIPPERTTKLPSRMTPGAAVTKPVIRPEIMYKGDEELIARERAARERRFATAPAYNKGGAVLVTDEMMKDITAGRTRRR